MYKINPVLITFIEESISQWKTNMTLVPKEGVLETGPIRIKRGIFQGHTAQTPTGPLIGVVFLVFLVGQLCSDQISFSPLPPSKNPPYCQHGWNPHQCQESFVLGRSVVVHIDCLYTVFPKMMMNMHDMM